MPGFSPSHAGPPWKYAAIQDVPLRTNGIKVQDDVAMKEMLYRIVAMLTRMAMKFDGVRESDVEYHADIDYDHEHRFAEHEHDGADEPEQSAARERRSHGF